MGIQVTFGWPFSIEYYFIFHMLPCKLLNWAGFIYSALWTATFQILATGIKACFQDHVQDIFDSLYCACRSSPIPTAAGHQQDAEYMIVCHVCQPAASRFVLGLVDILVYDGYKQTVCTDTYRPFLHYPVSLCQNESLYEATHMKMFM